MGKLGAGRVGNGGWRVRRWNGRAERTMRWENKERGISIEGAITGLGKNLMLGKFSEFLKSNHSPLQLSELTALLVYILKKMPTV